MRVKEAVDQLVLLGYMPGDVINVRLLLPKKIDMGTALALGMAWEPEPGKIVPIPIDALLEWSVDGCFRLTRLRKNKQTGERELGQQYADGFAQLGNWNLQGYGVYLVPNMGGRTDEQITRCPTIFYECDHIDKAEQWQRLILLEGQVAESVRFTVVETAKSLHVYIRLSEAIAPAEWTILQQRLIQLQESDRSIHNPARLMRLAGFDHIAFNPDTKGLEKFPVSLVQRGEGVIAPALLDQVLPPWNLQMWQPQAIEGRAVRAGLYAAQDAFDIRNFAHHLEGFNEKGRQGWITCKCPQHDGVSFDSLHISADTGAFKCHGGCEASAVYRAALAIAVGNGYKVPQFGEPDQVAYQEYVALEQEEDRVMVAQEQERKRERGTVKGGSNVPSSKSAPHKDSEPKGGRGDTLFSESEIAEAGDEVRRLLAARDTRLDISHVLFSYLAESMKNHAAAMPTAPEALFTGYLAVAASCLGTSSVIRLPGGDWLEPSVLWMSIVASTGTLKTPTQNTVMKPLWELQAVANQEYDEALKAWKEAEKAYKKDPENCEDPGPEPVPVEYWLGDASVENMLKTHSENPRGFLVYKDEGDGWFSGQNKYRNGKGDDEENWLSLNSGGVVKQNRMDRKRRMELQRTAVSLFMGTQPESLRKHLHGDKDSKGVNARFLYCAVEMPLPLPPAAIPSPAIPFHNVLKDIYKRLLSLQPQSVRDEEGREFTQPTEYYLSEAAQKYWSREWMPAIVDRWLRETNPGLKACFAKYRGFAARIALVLHLTEWAANPANALKPPSLEISLKTLKQAVRTTIWYCKQAEYLYGSLEAPEAVSFTAEMVRIKEISERLAQTSEGGWLTPRIVKDSSRMFKTADQVKAVFAQMYEAGYGELDVSGKTTRWRWVEGNKIVPPSPSTLENLDTVTFEGGDAQSPQPVPTLTPVLPSAPIAPLSPVTSTDPRVGSVVEIDLSAVPQEVATAAGVSQEPGTAPPTVRATVMHVNPANGKEETFRVKLHGNQKLIYIPSRLTRSVGELV